MERLRRLRNPSTAPPTATALRGKVTMKTQRSVGVMTKDGKRPTSCEPQSQPREGPLDLEALNNKLQNVAQARDQEDDGMPRRETDNELVKQIGQMPGQGNKEIRGRSFEEQREDQAAGGGADSAFDNDPGATSQRSSRNGASTCPSIVVHPPDDEQPVVTDPSDFELFLQQAEDDERTRKEKGRPTLSKPRQEPSLNPFYSNDLASPSAAPPKLAEIQEAGDEESLDSSDDSSSQHTSSSMSSSSNDFAATDTQPTRTNTTSLGRHVSFCEPEKLRERSDSHGSAYHARGFESPKAYRAVTKRRSFRKMVKSYIRHF